MTLKEIIEKHGLPVKVRHESWDEHEWVDIMCVSHTSAVGFVASGLGYSDRLSAPNYTLYTEPKQKRVYYQAILRNCATGGYYTSGDLYISEEEVRDHCGSSFIKLLTDRPIEI
jgi:hypothetical protein